MATGFLSQEDCHYKKNLKWLQALEFNKTSERKNHYNEDMNTIFAEYLPQKLNNPDFTNAFTTDDIIYEHTCICTRSKFYVHDIILLFLTIESNIIICEKIFVHVLF